RARNCPCDAVSSSSSFLRPAHGACSGSRSTAWANCSSEAHPPTPGRGTPFGGWRPQWWHLIGDDTIFTPIAAEELPGALDVFETNLGDDTLARNAFARIRHSVENARGDEKTWRADAVALAVALGIETLDEEPQAAFSWDGCRIRTRSESSVVIH